MKKELFIFIGIFLVLSLGMHHKEFFSYPLEHFQNLSTSGAYGFGMLHPLIFSFLLYLLVFLPRAIIKFFKKNN